MPYLAIRFGKRKRITLPLAPTKGWPGWLLLILSNLLWAGIVMLFLFA